MKVTCELNERRTVGIFTRNQGELFLYNGDPYLYLGAQFTDERGIAVLALNSRGTTGRPYVTNLPMGIRVTPIDVEEIKIIGSYK